MKTIKHILRNIKIYKTNDLEANLAFMSNYGFLSTTIIHLEAQHVIV